MAGESQALPNSAPDPTVLTTEQLLREVETVKEWVQAQLAVRDQRLDSIDKATSVFNESLTRVPTDVQNQVGHLKELSDEKFASIHLQFKERDTRSERESRDNKVAVDAAFAAQKEAAAKQDDANQKAIDKSENATSDTINKLAELFETRTTGLSGLIADLKLTVSGIVSVKQGGKEATTAVYAFITFVAVALGIIATILALKGG